MRLPLQPADRLVKKSDLPPRATRVINAVHLGHIPEAGGNEDATAVLMT